jgi:hypothetical protein
VKSLCCRHFENRTQRAEPARAFFSNKAILHLLINRSKVRSVQGEIATLEKVLRNRSNSGVLFVHFRKKKLSWLIRRTGLLQEVVAFEEKPMAFIDRQPKTALGATIDLASIETGNRHARDYWLQKQLENLLQHAANRSAF